MPGVEVEAQHYVSELKVQRDEALETALVRGAQLRAKETECDALRAVIARLEDGKDAPDVAAS